MSFYVIGNATFKPLRFLSDSRYYLYRFQSFAPYEEIAILTVLCRIWTIPFGYYGYFKLIIISDVANRYDLCYDKYIKNGEVLYEYNSK